MCLIDLDVRVVHSVVMAGLKFQALDVPPLRERNRDDKRAKDIRAVGLEEIRLRHGHDEVWLSQLPLTGLFRDGWEILGIPFDRASVHPLLDERELPVAQASRAGELSVAGLRLPWRHVPGFGHSRNLRRTLTHVLERHQVEGRATARAMTSRALLEDDGSDVPIECHGGGLLR
jgi:hypothetical protein